MYRNLKFLSRVVLIFTVLCLFAVATPVFAQDRAEKIDEFVNLYYNYGQFNGSVLVAENGKVIFKKGYGLANMEWNIPNEPDTKFRLGSITKQFTAMLIMQLVEEKKIKLDKKITDYLPDYRKDTGDRITIHHLLTHTSGIPNYTNLPGYLENVSRNPYSVDEFVKKYCSGDMEFEPGSKFSYSNSGYFLLGTIIEKVTARIYEAVLKERILDPLHMNNTGYDHHAPIIPNRAIGYTKTFDGYVNAAYLDMSTPYSAGAMYSTVEDMYLWDQALYTDKLLSRKYMELMFKPYISAFRGSYAYGWAVNNVPVGETGNSIKVIQHGGGINGFNTLIARLVDDKYLIVLLNNTERTRLNDMCRGIINILYDEPYNLPKKSLRDVLVKTILEKDVESAIAEYHELKEKYPDDYDFTEIEMNLLGYQLLAMNKIEEAIEIFKLNIEVYPESFNTYDSMGEAYMINGDKELAIKNYAKSLELNPNNTNAIEMLGRLTKE